MTEDGESMRERGLLERLAAAAGFAAWDPGPQFAPRVLRIGLVEGRVPFFTVPAARPISGAGPSLRTMLKALEEEGVPDSGKGERRVRAPDWIPPGKSVDELELVMAAMGAV